MITTPLAVSLEGKVIADAICDLGVTHVISVPDTNLRTVLAELAARPSLKLMYVCTEDEAIGINAGLYMTGHKPMLLIQNNGFYACINTIKAIALAPRCRRSCWWGSSGATSTSASKRPQPAVHRLEPTMTTWEVPFVRIDEPDDVPLIRAAWDRAWATKGPSAAIVGAPSR